METPKSCGWSVHQRVTSLEDQLRIKRPGSVCRVRSQGSDVMLLPAEIREKLTKPTCNTGKDETHINLNDVTKLSASNPKPATTQSNKTYYNCLTSSPPFKDNRDTFLRRKSRNEYLIVSKMVEMKPKIVDDHGEWTRHMRFFQVSLFN